MLKIINAVVTDAAFLTGRCLGAALAGVEETIIKAHARRGVLDMTVADVNRRSDEGSLTYREIRQLTEIQTAAVKAEKAARR